MENKNKNKYNNENCNDSMKFEECELAILRHAVDETDKLQNEKIANSEDVKKMIHMVEVFLRDKKCIFIIFYQSFDIWHYV